MFGIKFTLLTDDKPLSSMFDPYSSKVLPHCMQRLAWRLHQYSFRIQHIAGNANTADSLSRLPSRQNDCSCRHRSRLLKLCTILWRGILDKNVIGSYDKVHYIEFACILSYRTRYAVMSYSVMLYCNRNTVLSYSVTLHRNQNSIVSYSDADVSYPVVIYRNLYAVVSYSVIRYRNLNGIVSYPMLLYRTRCYYIAPDATIS